MYNVQDYSVLYNSVVRPVIREGWHYIHICNTLPSMAASFHLEGKLGCMNKGNKITELKVYKQTKSVNNGKL